MAVQGSDFFMVSRAGALYKVLGSDILGYVQSQIGTSEFQVANITARNALANLSVGDRVYVADATGDATVGTGWAIYLYMGSNTWTKVAEQENMDVSTSITNLTYTAGPSNGIVVSSDGSDATLPAVDGTNAGLMLPAHKTKLDFLTVTALTNLDTMRASSHAAVTISGAASSNPITVDANQVLGFSIANLTTAP
jgi:hypothetical protein